MFVACRVPAFQVDWMQHTGQRMHNTEHLHLLPSSQGSRGRATHTLMALHLQMDLQLLFDLSQISHRRISWRMALPLAHRTVKVISHRKWSVTLGLSPQSLSLLHMTVHFSTFPQMVSFCNLFTPEFHLSFHFPSRSHASCSSSPCPGRASGLTCPHSFAVHPSGFGSKEHPSFREQRG